MKLLKLRSSDSKVERAEEAVEGHLEFLEDGHLRENVHRQCATEEVAGDVEGLNIGARVERGREESGRGSRRRSSRRRGRGRDKAWKKKGKIGTLQIMG
ncbi:hypothetical protein GYH30_004694 [Glycine max]|nr:hypothetical protein GYH30_004694 [Glycine max]